MVNHYCGSSSGPPHYSEYYVVELSHLLPSWGPIALQIGLRDYSRPKGPIVEFKFPNTADWLASIEARTRAYLDSAQRRDDDLVLAIRDDDITTVRSLIYAGARLSDINIMGGNDLCYATVKDDIELVRYLISHGADPDQGTGTGHTPLIFAAERGNYEMASELLRLGADRGVTDIYGHTALHYASVRRDKRIARLLRTSPGTKR